MFAAPSHHREEGKCEGVNERGMVTSECLQRYARAPHTFTRQQYNTHRVSQLFCIGIGLHKNVCSTSDGFWEMRIFVTPSSHCRATPQSDINKLHISMDPPSLSFIFANAFCCCSFVPDFWLNFKFDLQFLSRIRHLLHWMHLVQPHLLSGCLGANSTVYYYFKANFKFSFRNVKSRSG